MQDVTVILEALYGDALYEENVYKEPQPKATQSAQETAPVEETTGAVIDDNAA